MKRLAGQQHPITRIDLTMDEPIPQQRPILFQTLPQGPVTQVLFPEVWCDFISYCERVLLQSVVRLGKQKKQAGRPKKKARVASSEQGNNQWEQQAWPDDVLLCILTLFLVELPTLRTVSLFLRTLSLVCRQWKRVIHTAPVIWQRLILASHNIIKVRSQVCILTENLSAREMRNALCLDALNHQCEYFLRLYTEEHHLPSPYKSCACRFGTTPCHCPDLSDPTIHRPVPPPRTANKIGLDIYSPLCATYNTLRDHAMRFRRMCLRSQTYCFILVDVK